MHGFATVLVSMHDVGWCYDVINLLSPLVHSVWIERCMLCTESFLRTDPLKHSMEAASTSHTCEKPCFACYFCHTCHLVLGDTGLTGCVMSCPLPHDPLQEVKAAAGSFFQRLQPLVSEADGATLASLVSSCKDLQLYSKTLLQACLARAEILLEQQLQGFVSQQAGFSGRRLGVLLHSLAVLGLKPSTNWLRLAVTAAGEYLFFLWRCSELGYLRSRIVVQRHVLMCRLKADPAQLQHSSRISPYSTCWHVASRRCSKRAQV